MGNKRNRNKDFGSSSIPRGEMSQEEAIQIFEMFSALGTLRKYLPYGQFCIVKNPPRFLRKDLYDAARVLARKNIEYPVHFWIPSETQLRYLFPKGINEQPTAYIQFVIKHAVSVCTFQQRFVLTDTEFADLVRPLDEQVARHKEIVSYCLNGDDISTIGQGPIVKILEKFIEKSCLSSGDAAALIAHIDACPDCFMRNLIAAINACAAHMDKKTSEVVTAHDSHGQLAIEELERMMTDPLDEH